jgi:hypothetical protein
MHKFGQLLRPIEAAESVALSLSYLARLRHRGDLTEGVHYVRYGLRTYRYFSESLFNWALHRAEPAEHQQWIKEKEGVE